MGSRWIYPASAALALACMACAGQNAAAPDRPAIESPLVEALPAQSGSLPLVERLSGIVNAENQVAVRAEIDAPILEVLVRSGDAVALGQPLVRLESTSLRERLRQEEANLRLAEATAAEAAAQRDELGARVVRARALAGQSLISEQELDTLEAQLTAAHAATAQAEASVDEARAIVEQARTAASKTVVRSPVSGHVGRREAEVGMIATPATPLFTVGNLDSLIVEVQLTEEMLGDLRPGQTARVHSPALADEPIVASLSRISPFLAPGSFSTTGEIDVTNSGDRLKPGMFVTVDVLYGESERATLVPSSALWEEPTTGQWGVYVVASSARTADGAADADAQPRAVEFRPVAVLAEGGERAGVSGVEPGEWVVVLGQHLLRPTDDATARVRVTSWERVLELQRLQREDLLRGFLDKQQRWAREHGAAPPTNEEFLGGEIPAGAPAAGAGGGR
ncbi:MAG TPA: efflux RND transporter periplasmic adaptor subunit [Candidatus Polarisedimenticolaceae bacterium]|nr:efflux RND transporter periplasmic adaptor subunit [Candidatus Polarisedimenticolaceae bacterium]